MTAVATASVWLAVSVLDALARARAAAAAQIWRINEPTVTADTLTNWWNDTPLWAKLAVAGLALVLVIVGIVKRLVVLTLIAALIGFGLLGWWWWVNYGSKL